MLILHFIVFKNLSFTYTITKTVNRVLFASVGDALNAKLSTYVAGVITNGVLFGTISFSEPAEKFLRNIHDIRMHHLIIDVPGAQCDFDELRAKPNGLMFDIPAKFNVSGFENNTLYAFVSNPKALGALLGTYEDVLRSLSAMRPVHNGELRYEAVGACVRTRKNPRSPGVLLFRF